MNNKLLFQSNNDVPFLEAKVVVHQPTIKEIALIGEDVFFRGSELLTLSKENIPNVGKNDLKGFSNFDIIMSVINNKDLSSQKEKINLLLTLSLLFPDYKIKLSNNQIILTKDEKEFFINSSNHESFKKLLIQMLCLDQNKGDNKKYNPANGKAAEIAEKLRKGKQKVNQLKNNKQNQDVHILLQYVSILSVGLQKDKNQLMNYTIPQLYDEYKRFEMKYQYDMYVQQKMLGAKNLKEIKFWMDDIY